ncbi:MAG: flagellar biosynthesis protein FlhA [Alphaproteobacteria bacterium]|nr:flagellar biosynthesis protein FlhA [Alphaproteobacteria bacterium]
MDNTETETQTGIKFNLGNILEISKRGDLLFAFGLIIILSVLILPLPAVILDLLLAVSITFSVLVLMTSLFIHSSMEFSAFPTVLLIATIIRLGLNLASTRLIMANGHEGTDAAGHVIEAFGHFVMRGNVIIGMIVFSILVLVNFVVITKGSGRIAEVAARFTLDAMPGKQMAVDADLSAGLIDENEARDRRRKLEDESSFYGAMDGASKFVRGDAIAGLLITFINIIGGMIVGIVQNNLSLSEAGHTYTLLTIGDGLVSQIPALIVSTAAGLLVSKAGIEGAADKTLFRQLSSYPKALGMSSFVMLIMSLLPGMPVFPFLLLSFISGFCSYRAICRNNEKKSQKKAEETKATSPHTEEEETLSSILHMDELRIELGYGLLRLIGKNGKEDRLTSQIKALRRQLANEMGFIMPSVRILDNMQIAPNSYIIKLKEISAGEGTLFPDQLMVMNPKGEEVDLPGTNTTEPTFGLSATWIAPSLREEAALKGYTVVDPATVLSTHLTEILKSNISELLSYAEVQKLLKEITGEHKKLIEDLIPGQITATALQRVLQSLLNERISIRDLQTILEGIAEIIASSSNIQAITEHVRSRLSRQICAMNVSHAGYLPLITLSPQWEKKFTDSIKNQDNNPYLAMPPSMLQDFITQTREHFGAASKAGETPALLTSPGIRPFVGSITSRFLSHTHVISQNEIHSQAKLKTVGSI